MARITLSTNEKNVLYQLTAYPESTDAEIGQRAGMGTSTVTKIRKRLTEGGFIRVVIIPSFQRLGAEILDVRFGEFGPDIPPGRTRAHSRKQAERAEQVEETMGMFLVMGDGNQGMGMGFHRNYTEAMESLQETKRLMYDKQHDSLPQIKQLIFSLRLARIYRFFNYAPLLATSFGITDPGYREPELSLTWKEPFQPTRKERIVLYGLVRYPGHNDMSLASMLGITRQTISAMKSRFSQDGLLTRRYIPDLAQLGFDVVVFAHVELKNAEGLDPELLRSNMMEGNNITSILHGSDIMTLSANTSFTDTKERIASFLRDTRIRSLLTRDPLIYLWSATTLASTIDHQYHSSLRKILGLDAPLLIPKDR